MKFNYLVVIKIDESDVAFTGVTDKSPDSLLSSCIAKLRNVISVYRVVRFIYQPLNEDKNGSSSSSSPA